MIGALLIQQQILRNSSYGANKTQTKKQYYKLLKLKPMFIKLNVSSHGSQFLPQIINASMIKEISGGYRDLNGVSPDKWCVVRLIDGDELYVVGLNIQGNNTAYSHEPSRNRKLLLKKRELLKLKKGSH